MILLVCEVLRSKWGVRKFVSLTIDDVAVIFIYPPELSLGIYNDDFKFPATRYVYPPPLVSFCWGH